MGVADFLIPYEDMLMLISSSAYLSKGVVDLLTPYEDKFMWLPLLTYLSEGVVEDLLTRYEEKFYSTHLSEGVADVDLLWK